MMMKSTVVTTFMNFDIHSELEISEQCINTFLSISSELINILMCGCQS